MKILSKIFEPVQEKGKWIIQYNEELYQLLKSPNTITTIEVIR